MYYIYLIVNKVNGKTYVGQRKSSKEWYEDKYMGSGVLLAKAKQKYGIKNFEKFLIQHCYSKEETDKAEKFWIAEYRRRGKAEYNIADGGQGGNLGEEVNKKISEANKGKKKPPISEETRKKMSVANSGKHHTEETKRKISDGNKGKHRTEEQKRSLSEETKRKTSEAMKGKHLSEETKKKMSEAHKGKVSWNKGNKGILHWYNNSEISILAKECPEGFVKGRLCIHH